MGKQVAKVNQQLATIRVRTEDVLEDSDQWVNRFHIHSETSDRVYVVAQNRKKRHFACSCPSYRVRRYCKHLQVLGLPCHERAHEVEVVKT